MNDRYLFRAKRKDNGEWVEGYYVQTVVASYIVVPYKHNTILGEGETIEVDPSTICQCTGMSDKNSKVAYEHDIIKTPVGNARIEWNCSPIPTDNHIDVGFKVFFFDEKANDYYRHDLGYWLEKSEVIGSVFDNPELLEVEP